LESIQQPVCNVSRPGGSKSAFERFKTYITAAKKRKLIVFWNGRKRTSFPFPVISNLVIDHLEKPSANSAYRQQGGAPRDNRL
jgi:hypothetical protein